MIYCKLRGEEHKPIYGEIDPRHNECWGSSFETGMQGKNILKKEVK